MDEHMDIETIAYDDTEEQKLTLAAAAHDLKTPVTTIKALAQMLSLQLARHGTLDPEPTSAALARIEAATTRMTTLINELLDENRIEAGEPLELMVRPIDLIGLARETIAERLYLPHGHSVMIATGLVELVGMWDSFRLERVLTNLIDNAVKYSPEGGQVTVTIAQEEDDRGTWAVLEVRDHGIGIPASDVPYIFDPFYRARNVVGRIGGSGVGLAGVCQIIQQHGGTIQILTEEAKGTVVTLRLPLMPRCAERNIC